ncbi:condensin complex subunit 1 isoform X2 [Amia ocellicauda]|uniref:condensin complex subunit 1 isoform X2 n=1 Tax=Amia ocellicauda TaxID=2972642 RepID=UPI003464BFE5
MSPLEFCIPMFPAELLKAGGIGQYVVQELVSVKQLGSHLHSFRAALKSQGPLCILEHFDTPYSVLHHFQTVDQAVKTETLDLLVKVVSGLAVSLATVLSSPSLPAADRKQQQTAVKMAVFLLCRLVESLESAACLPGYVTAPSKGSKRARPAGGSEPGQWDSDREEVLQCLSQLLQLEIRALWSLSLVDEDFISCVSSCCYKLLETPAISQARSRTCRLAVLHLLGLLVKRYNHMLGASVKVVQFLQHFEHLPSVFAQALQLWTEEYGVKGIVGEVIREISLKSSEEMAREGSGVKAYSCFLAELAALVPEAVLPHVSVILPYLEGECVSLRVGVCEVLGELVLRCLSGEDQAEGRRTLRGQLLDTLQEHCLDTSAQVRARALQLFTRVLQSKALPLVRYRELLCVAVGRLCDRSVIVCKSAIQLLCAFICNNPYSCKLSSADLKAPLEKELAKLRALREQQRPAAPVIEAWEVWQAMEPELLQTVWVELERGSEAEGDREEEIQAQGSAQDAALRVRQLLHGNKYRQAVRLVLSAVTLFPQSELFRCTSPTSADGLMGVLGLVFKGPEKTPDPPTDTPPERSEGPEEDRSEGEKEGEPSELQKQEMLVQYLRDTESFALQVEEAIATIGTMLYWKTTSVVQEAVQFCVAVCEFGVSQSLVVMRRLLPLVWSKDTAVKEAAMEACRRLYLHPQGETQRLKAQTLVHSLSLLMIDASLGTIQCLEEIVLEFLQGSALQASVVQVLWERFTGRSQCSALERRAAVLLLGIAARVEKEVVLSNLDTLISVALGERVTEDFLLARDTCIAITKIADQHKSGSSQPFRLPADHPLFTALTDAITAGLLLSDAHWLSFMEQAINLLYQLSESPDKTCARLLRRSAQQLLDDVAEGGGAQPEGGQSETGDQGGQVRSASLAHLLSLCGSVAFRQLQHLERSVSAELRRRRAAREERDSVPQRRGQASNESAVEAEMGLTGASADDTEAELIRKICETELLSDDSVLSCFLPLLVSVCSSPGRYSHPPLYTATCLALAKYMMISSTTCERNVQLLVTVLDRAAVPGVRSNAAVAVGDLTVRFPNLLEPWTPHLYARLSDACPSVRLTALTVLTHLVLKDMVKVKGQASEMSLLLVDPDPPIRSLALNFFNELAAKDNAIYNLLPDIISRLSEHDRAVKEDDFNTIIKQLFSYITKDKQSESLVEKLCQRIRTAKECQLRALSQCLSLLPVSDRALGRLQENWECYCDKLGAEGAGLYEALLSLTARMRRGAKPELRAQIEEFERRLTAVHTRGLENVEEGGAPSPSGSPAPGHADRRPTRGKGRSLAAQNGGDSAFSTPRPRPNKGPRAKPCIAFSSDEEDADLDAQLSETETPKVTTPITRSSRRTRLRN